MHRPMSIEPVDRGLLLPILLASAIVALGAISLGG